MPDFVTDGSTLPANKTDAGPLVGLSTQRIQATEWNNVNSAAMDLRTHVLALEASNSGDMTLAAVGSTPNTNGASLSGQILTLQPASASFPGFLTIGAQTIAGNKTFTGTVTASGLSGTNTGDMTLAAVGAVPNANGASISGQVLTLQPASATQPGVMTIGAQTFAGQKTFKKLETADLAGTTFDPGQDGNFTYIDGSPLRIRTNVAGFGMYFDETAGALTMNHNSGSNALLLNVAGARMKFSSGGTTDYLSGNGTIQITAAGDFGVTGTLKPTAVVGIELASTGRIYWGVAGNYISNHGASGLMAATSGWKADVAAGNNAFLISATGARLKFSDSGTTDYLFSNGSTLITAAGAFAATAFSSSGTNAFSGQTPLHLTHSSPFIYASAATGPLRIVSGITSGNAGATAATAMIAVYPDNALDAADWVMSIATAANAAQLFSVTYGGKALAVGGIGVGNSAAATTPGTVTKKMEVFDAAGTSLGFVPIYDAIT